MQSGSRRCGGGALGESFYAWAGAAHDRLAERRRALLLEGRRSARSEEGTQSSTSSSMVRFLARDSTRARRAANDANTAATPNRDTQRMRTTAPASTSSATDTTSSPLDAAIRTAADGHSARASRARATSPNTSFVAATRMPGVRASPSRTPSSRTQPDARSASAAARSAAGSCRRDRQEVSKSVGVDLAIAMSCAEASATHPPAKSAAMSTSRTPIRSVKRR